MTQTDNINDLPFKLRFTSTEKLCKEITKLIHDRYEVLDKLCTEYETIGEHKLILGNIKTDLHSCHDALKQLRSLCQCQSDDDKIAVNRQLANSEELLDKLELKFNGIATVKMLDISVNRLPSNWRAAMLKIARDKAKKAFNDNVVSLSTDTNSEPKEDNNDNNENNGRQLTDNNSNENNDNIDKEENRNDDSQVLTEKPQNTEEPEQKLEEAISIEAQEINQQFEIDLERKIYEAQVEELMSMVQMLIMKIKTMKARIDISKQLIKVAIKMKREYESSNLKLKEAMATCHCAEAGADDDVDFQKRMEDKKQLEETVERLSNDLKYWEEQYSILKEGRNAKNNNIENKEEINKEANTTTTIVEVTEEAMEQELAPIASTSSQQSCMYASQPQQTSSSQQGTANPAVIYLEGLVAHQQPTYIPTTNIQHPLGMYPHTYSIGHPHHPYHQAPDGSIQVYSSDITSHPGYIAYQ